MHDGELPLPTFVELGCLLSLFEFVGFGYFEFDDFAEKELIVVFSF